MTGCLSLLGSGSSCKKETQVENHKDLTWTMTLAREKNAWPEQAVEAYGKQPCVNCMSFLQRRSIG